MFWVNWCGLMNRYRAPWGKLLIGTSSVLTVICVVVGIAVWLEIAQERIWIGALPLLLAGVCSLFAIRGYTLTPDAILVHRLFWTTELSRQGLSVARVQPNAMNSSIRIFGNGGFYSFSGYYWNRALGTYRAFVTDHHRTVVLTFGSRRPVVLSPDAPEQFVRDLGF
jgi:hypothetical protein